MRSVLQVSIILSRSVSLSRQSFGRAFTAARGSAEGSLTASWHARGKTLFLAGGIATFVAASTSLIAYSYRISASAKEAEQDTDDEKRTAVKKVLESYGVQDDDVDACLPIFEHITERFVQRSQSMKYEKKKAEAEKILKWLNVSESKEKTVIQEMHNYLQEKTEKKYRSTPENCLINDAIHGPIELTPLLFQIINTPEFHRLKDVRQLGAAHYVYPGANHTRFDHSVGVCHLAGVFAKSLKHKLEEDTRKKEFSDFDDKEKKQYRFDDEEVLCVQIAGLCHDLGHGPFSHMFEGVMGRLDLKETKGNGHELLSKEIFKHMLVENPKVLAEFVDQGLTKNHVELVQEMIHPPKDPHERTYPYRMFLYEIVANSNTGIDVDKWDYYARDCHYLGVQQDFQWRRCMLLARIVKTPTDCKYIGEGQLRIAFREKELDNIYGMFKTRASLHQKAYKHKTIQAVERMIADAFVSVKDVFVIRVDSKGESKSIEEAVQLACHKDNTKVDLKWYLALTDSIIGTIQCAGGTSKEQCEKLQNAQELLTRVKKRDLYSCSVRIPISKSACRCDTHLGDNTQCMKCNEDEKRVKVVKSVKLSEKEKLSFKKDVCKDLPQIEPGDIWLKVEKLKLPSEGDEDPVKQVVFYDKPMSQDSLPHAIKRENVKKPSKLVVPQAMVEYELRVYDKREKAKRKKDDAKKLNEATTAVLNEWVKNKKFS